MEGVVIALVVTLVKGLIKNPQKKGKLKKVLLTLRDAIDAVYAGE